MGGKKLEFLKTTLMRLKSHKLLESLQTNRLNRFERIPFGRKWNPFHSQTRNVLNYSTAYHIHNIFASTRNFNLIHLPLSVANTSSSKKTIRRPRTNAQPSITMSLHRLAASCVLAAVIILRLPKTAARPIARQMNASLSTTPIMLDRVLRLTDKSPRIESKQIVDDGKKPALARASAITTKSSKESKAADVGDHLIQWLQNQRKPNCKLTDASETLKNFRYK